MDFVSQIISYITGNATLVAWIGAIFSGIFSWRVKCKESKVQKELQKVAAYNEQLTYMKNKQFDYVFDIYKDLSKKTFLLTSALNTYYFQGFRQIHSTNAETRKKAEELLHNVIEMYYEYRNALFMSGAFMKEEQFVEFEKFMQLCFSQYQLFYNAKYYEDNDKLFDVEEKANSYDAQITKAQTNLIKTLRLYLAKYMPE